MFTGKRNQDGTAERAPRSSTPMRRLITDPNGTREVVVDCKLGTALAPGAVVDTGAGRSGMSAAFWHRNRAHFGPLDKRAARDIVIEPVSGQRISPLGVIRTPITFCDKEAGNNFHVDTHEFLVLDNMSTDVLIGMDLMQPNTAIQAVAVASGKISYNPSLRTTDYTPVSHHAVSYPVRLTTALNLQPGETRPVRLEISAEAKARTGLSLLIQPAVLVSDFGTRFTLNLPDQLRTLEDSTHRTFITTVSNPTPKPIRILSGLVIAQATHMADHQIAPLAHPTRPITSYAVRRLPLTLSREKVSRAMARLTSSEKKAWLDHELEKLVGTLVSGMECPAVAEKLKHKPTVIPLRSAHARKFPHPDWEPATHDVTRNGHLTEDTPLAHPHGEQL